MLYSSVSSGSSVAQAPPTNGSDKIRVVIADDHPVVREGLAAILNTEESIHLVAEAGNGRQLVQVVRHHRPDVILTDMRMPEMDGIAALQEMKRMNHLTRCILLSQYDEEQLILDAVRAGAIGFLVKTASRSEIRKAIESAYRFQPYYCASSATKLNHITAARMGSEDCDKPSLTDREISIIKLVCEEKSSREIGEVLFISSRTVEGHKERIKEKIGTHTTAGIILYAIASGIYKLPYRF